MCCNPSQPKHTKSNKDWNHDRTERPVVCRYPGVGCKNSKENQADDRVLEHRDSTRQFFLMNYLQSPRLREVRIWVSTVFTVFIIHFTKDRNGEICQEKKIPRAPVQKTQWRSRASCKFFFGDLTTADHKCSQWNLWISKQSSICSRGAGLRHPMDPVVSVQNKNFRKHREACKSSWSQIGSLKSFPLTFLWNLAKLVKIFLGNIVRRHPHRIRNKWDCWQNSAQSKGRHFCRIVAIRSEWKLVGRFHGMLIFNLRNVQDLLSDGKTSTWETFWGTI